MMTANMHDFELSHEMWGEHVLPHIFIGERPHELWKGSIHLHKYLKMWGCIAKSAISPLKKTQNFGAF